MDYSDVELFTRNNRGVDFYREYQDRYKKLIKEGNETLPIAAAYNTGFDEGYKRARNELCHIYQTKKD